MTTVTDHNGRRALDRFAVRRGYADIDVFLAAGNSLLEAHELLISERDDIVLALQALFRIRSPNWNEKLAEAECEATGEPVAALQGDEA